MLYKTIELNFLGVKQDDSSSRATVMSALRMLTDMSLRDARDLIDRGGVTQIQTRVGDMTDTNGRVISAQMRFDQALSLLRSAGVRVIFGPDSDLLNVIREVTVKALDRGNLDLADSLLATLKRFS